MIDPRPADLRHECEALAREIDREHVGDDAIVGPFVRQPIVAEKIEALVRRWIARERERISVKAIAAEVMKRGLLHTSGALLIFDDHNLQRAIEAGLAAPSTEGAERP